jgi:GMP synthase (glutamine-hydrolysing)
MEKIAVLDFGGQYAHLLARRIRQLGVYSVIVEPETFIPSDEIGLIFSGGPRSVTDEQTLSINFSIEQFKRPILGICYGHQLLAKLMGGTISAGHTREYGLAQVQKQPHSVLFADLPNEFQAWMSHGDHVSRLPSSINATASTSDVNVAAFEDTQNERFGVQFHPEVVHTECGLDILRAFVNRCEPKDQWTASNRTRDLIAKTRQQIGDRKALLLLSGGVDSLVAWAICNQATPQGNLTAIHVDTGLMRKDESKNIMEFLAKNHFTNVHLIDAEKRFLDALRGVSDPEEKRKIIGTKFVEVANDSISNLFGNQEDVVLIQGTIYPDTIESGGTKNAAKIKTHHNRVDAIQKLIEAGRVVEPLAELYKDEVREVGITLGLPHELVFRHPFPGPGLGVRLLCTSSADTANADPIVDRTEFDELAAKFGFSSSVLGIKSVGVQGDGRTYAHPGVLYPRNKSVSQIDWKNAADCARQAINSMKNINRVVVSLLPLDPTLKIVNCDSSRERLDLLREVDAVVSDFCLQEKEIWQAPVVGLPLQNAEGEWAFVIRPVKSVDGMTADFFPFQGSVVEKMIEKLKQIRGVGAIFYDVTSKPPATIEWE